MRITMKKEIKMNDIAIRAKSLKEVSNVLTVEGGLKLPPMMDENKKYIKCIMRVHAKFCILGYQSYQVSSSPNSL